MNNNQDDEKILFSMHKLQEFWYGPTIWVKDANTSSQLQCLPLCSHIFYFDVKVCLAYVSITSKFINTVTDNAQGVYSFPTFYGKAMISSCSFTINQKLTQTTFIDPEKQHWDPDNNLIDIMKDCQEISKDQSTFLMPISDIPRDAEIFVVLQYIQPMMFNHKHNKYEIYLPTQTHPDQRIHQDKSINDYLLINGKYYPGQGWERGVYCVFDSKTHTLKERQRDDGKNCIIMQAELNKNTMNRNFQFQYQVSNDDVVVKCFVQKDSAWNQATSQDESGSFIIFIAPPEDRRIESEDIIPRDIVSPVTVIAFFERFPLRSELARMA